MPFQPFDPSPIPLERPTFTGDNRLNEYLGRLYAGINSLHSTVSTLASRAYTNQSDIPSFIEISKQLQSSGSAPLNVTNLQGLLYQPQNTYVPAVTSLPDLSDPLSQDGQLVRFAGGLWVFNSATQEPGQWERVTTYAVFLTGTHAVRLSDFDPPSVLGLAEGTVYWETDRLVLYMVRAGVWTYILGSMFGTLAPDLKPTDLGIHDTRFSFYAADYMHHYMWDGTAWTFAPGDPGSRHIVMAGNWGPPEGGLWQYCDTSIVLTAMNDGSLVAVQTPELNTDIFIYGGFPGPPVAATQGAIVAGSRTELESTHTHNVPSQIINTGGPDNTVFFDTGDGTTGTASAASTSHQHNATIPLIASAAGTPHRHDLDPANVTTQPPTFANGGLPRRQGLAFWMRR